MNIPEWMTRHHLLLRQGVRLETVSADGGGYEGEHSEGLRGLRNITEIGNVIEVTGSYHGGIW